MRLVKGLEMCYIELNRYELNYFTKQFIFLPRVNMFHFMFTKPNHNDLNKKLPLEEAIH